MNKVIIIIVFLLFGAPVLIATLLHSEWFDVRLGGTRNHGELVQPVIPLPALSLRQPDGRALEHADLLERWQLVHLRAADCADACLEDLYWLRQIRRAQNRHQPDIGLMLISLAEIDEDQVVRIRELADDFVIVSGSDAAALASVFPDVPDEGRSYILDPMANIIMRYAEDADPNHVRRDLRRLLTWTQRN